MRYNNPPKIDHKGFSLRPIETDDISAWYEYLRLPHVVEHTSWNLSSEEDLEPSILKCNSTCESSNIRFTIKRPQSNKLIGTVGFHSITPAHKTAEITYDLHPDFWGQGVCSAACKAVTAWGFEVPGFVRIQATTLKSNEPSKKVLQKCGYEYEGILRKFRMVRGIPHDFLIYSKVFA
ncbi:MAG: GNAT family protein [Pseudomonadota bacterium]